MPYSNKPTGGRFMLGPGSPSLKRGEFPPVRFIALPPAPTRRRKQRQGDFLSPSEVAAMWGVAHDKVLEFIKTGELAAFNVASKRSSRPQFRVTLAAVKAFQERRSGRDPARSAPPVTPRRTSSKKPQPSNREYF